LLVKFCHLLVSNQHNIEKPSFYFSLVLFLVLAGVLQVGNCRPNVPSFFIVYMAHS